MSNSDKLIETLYEKQIFQDLEIPIELKSGKISSFYADFRKLYTDPKLFNIIATCLAQYIPSTTDYIAGSPLGAIPLTTLLSQKLNIPFLLVRPNAKKHGTKRLVEGLLHKPDANITIIEDVITTGKSTMETYDKLKQTYPEANITNVVAIFDREQNNIKLKIRTLFNMSQISKASNISHLSTIYSENDLKLIKYYEQSKPTNNQITNKLLATIKKKRSNLIFSADLTTTYDLITVLSKVAPYIIAVKVHTDILKDAPTQKFINQLQTIAKKHNLIIIEDRKFTDIGSTLKNQLTSQLNIASWADAVTAFPCITKTGIKIINDYGIAPIIIEQLSTYTKSKKTDDNPYISPFEKDNIKKYTHEHYSFSSSRLINDLDKDQFYLGTIGQTDTLHWQFTPGISLLNKTDNLNQNYKTPIQAAQNGADFFIVGRSIYQTTDPAKTAQYYKVECWNAKSKTLNTTTF